MIRYTLMATLENGEGPIDFNVRGETPAQCDVAAARIAESLLDQHHAIGGTLQSHDGRCKLIYARRDTEWLIY